MIYFYIVWWILRCDLICINNILMNRLFYNFERIVLDCILVKYFGKELIGGGMRENFLEGMRFNCLSVYGFGEGKNKKVER